MTVVDASALLDALLRVGDADARLDTARRRGEIAVPHLIDLEVISALARRLRRGEVDISRARFVIAALSELPVVRFPHSPWTPRIWSLRHNFSTYDAAYVALAETLDAPVLTNDRKLAVAIRSFTRIPLA